jgi:hypothetical protein
MISPSLSSSTAHLSPLTGFYFPYFLSIYISNLWSSSLIFSSDFSSIDLLFGIFSVLFFDQFKAELSLLKQTCFFLLIWFTGNCLIRSGKTGEKMGFLGKFYGGFSFSICWLVGWEIKEKNKGSQKQRILGPRSREDRDFEILVWVLW